MPYTVAVIKNCSLIFYDLIGAINTLQKYISDIFHIVLVIDVNFYLNQLQIFLDFRPRLVFPWLE